METPANHNCTVLKFEIVQIFIYWMDWIIAMEIQLRKNPNEGEGVRGGGGGGGDLPVQYHRAQAAHAQCKPCSGGSFTKKGRNVVKNPPINGAVPRRSRAVVLLNDSPLKKELR